MTREVSLALTWAGIAGSALLVMLTIGALPNSGAGALAEALIGAPMAVWLGQMTALALHRREWRSLSGAAIRRAGDPAVFWVATAAMMISAGVFSLGFARAVLSLALMP